MKIAIVTPFYPNAAQPNAGGIGNHFQHLALGFKEEGHKVTVFQFPYVGKTNASFKHHGIQVRQYGFTHPKWFKVRGLGRLARISGYRNWYPSRKLYQLTRKVLRRDVEKQGFEVIEATSNRGLPYAYTLSGDRRLPVISRVSTTMMHHFEENNETPDINQRKEAWYEKQTIARSNALVTHTRAHAEKLETELELPAGTFNVIPHGIDIPMKPEPQSQTGGDIKVLYIGRFESRKGADVLLEAIPEVLAELTHVRFLLAGNDRDRSYQSKFEEKHNSRVLSKVDFLGQVSDEKRTQLYRDCDIFVAPSRYESFGIVYAEAMSYGKPVIGCNAGGAPEVIGTESGLLARPGDSADLAAQTLKLCKDGSLRESMGRNAYQRVSEFFCRGKMARDTVNLYQQVLVGRN